MTGEIPNTSPQAQETLARGLQIAANLGLPEDVALIEINCTRGHGSGSIAEALALPAASEHMQGVIGKAKERAGQAGKEEGEIDREAVGKEVVTALDMFDLLIKDPSAPDSIKRVELPSGFAAHLEIAGEQASADQADARAQKKSPLTNPAT